MLYRCFVRSIFLVYCYVDLLFYRLKCCGMSYYIILLHDNVVCVFDVLCLIMLFCIIKILFCLLLCCLVCYKIVVCLVILVLCLVPRKSHARTLNSFCLVLACNAVPQ